MASNAIHEMIAAYAAGCIDKKNHQNFREYMESGGDLPVGELGELQNVISLLPVILELETPNPDLKDKVAKKLISLQGEIKEKIKTTKQNQSKQYGHAKKEIVSPTAPTEIPTNLSEPEEETTESNRFTPVTPPSLSHTRDTDFYDAIRPNNQPPPPTSQYDLPPRSIKDIKSNKKGKISFTWIAIGLVFIILLAGLIIVYYSTTQYQTQIASLEKELSGIQNELSTSRQFVNKYDKLIQIMNYEDTKIIPLSAANNNTSGNGKLLISFNHREGLLNLNDMPTLGSNQAFQVWLISDGRSYSLGSFVPNPSDKYIEISDIPYIPMNRIELVRVTIEPLSGSNIPQGPAVLLGSVRGS